MINYFDERELLATDLKGRLRLPQEVRDRLKIKASELLYLLPILDESDPPYLEIRTERQWEEYIQTLRQGDAGGEKREAVRIARMRAKTASIDAQGRILIPQKMREACGLGESVAVFDMIDYIEVWSADHIKSKLAAWQNAFKLRHERTY